MIKNQKLKDWYNSLQDKRRNELLKVLDVEYAHLRLKNNDDLYVTPCGLQYLEFLLSQNGWRDQEWYSQHSSRLRGTSAVYKVKTDPINGEYKEFVLKWNRMGQEIPGEEDCEELMGAEFNSPFEEFSLVLEMKKVLSDAASKVSVPRPLAIYVPSESVELWQSGRKEYRMQYKINSHKEIALDLHRLYAVVYEWLEGVDVTQAFDGRILEEKYMKLLTLDAANEMQKEGFLVRDNKPEHVIVNPRGKDTVRKNKKGEILYALVDFELLARTRKREQIVKKAKRTDYLTRQRDRFSNKIPNDFHPHLHHINIFGVEYVYGHVESTQGKLWVVGKDPYLFDYFLPERWQHTFKTKISKSREMYHAITKDHIHIVWKISEVGKLPEMDPVKEDERKILKHGFNSPFEEFAIAIELSKYGLTTIYPRAIYMKSERNKDFKVRTDKRRFISHKNILTPEGDKMLSEDHDYVVIWGYWNGPDDKLAANDNNYYQGMDILNAFKSGLITEEQYFSFLRKIKTRLARVGYEDLDLRGNHVMLSLDSKGEIITEKDGSPELRICNFEFLKQCNR